MEPRWPQDTRRLLDGGELFFLLEPLAYATPDHAAVLAVASSLAEARLDRDRLNPQGAIAHMLNGHLAIVE
jgi:hypothetical protein